MPVMQDRTVKIDLPLSANTPNPAPNPALAPNAPDSTPAPSVNAAADILATHNAVLHAVASGDLSPQEGHNVSQIVEARRRSWESVELSNRIADLEHQARQLRESRKTR